MSEVAFAEQLTENVHLRRNSTPRSPSPTPPAAEGNEALFRLVVAKVSDFKKRQHMPLRADVLADKLTRMAKIEEKLKATGEEGGNNSRQQSLSHHQHPRSTLKGLHSAGAQAGDDFELLQNDYFRHFAHAMLAEEEDDSAVKGSVEYLTGSAIYFGATIALQARHGGFVSCSTAEIRAGGQKAGAGCRLVVKKSGDLTNAGMVSYGDALWLQLGANYVFGATYGRLVDKKRMIQPALVSCKRQSMFKAQQYGRWIILKRNDPIASLGKPVCHMDRIMLEQEWAFLASASGAECSMSKTVSNSDEAMRTKTDLFSPSEDCSFTLHLVALPSDQGQNEKQRQKLLQRAQEQIELSEGKRGRRVEALLSSLSDKLPAHLREKKEKGRDEEEMLQLLAKMRQSNFVHGIGVGRGGERLLERAYGPDSRILEIYRDLNEGRGVMKCTAVSYESNKLDRGRRGSSSSSNSIGEGEKERQLERNYWGEAQRLLVPSQAWALLPQSLLHYRLLAIDRKNRAAEKIQLWFRKVLERCFDFERQMKRVDRESRERLERKAEERYRLLAMQRDSEDTGQEHERHNYPSAHFDPCHRLKTSSALHQVTFKTQSTYRIDRHNSLSHSPDTPVPLSVAKSRSRASSYQEPLSLSSKRSPLSPLQEREVESIVAALAQTMSIPTSNTKNSSLSKERPHSSHSCTAANNSNVAMEKERVRPNSASTVPLSHPKERRNLAYIQLQKDKERLAGGMFGLPSDVFQMPVLDAYESNAKVGLRFLKSLKTKNDKDSLFKDIQLRKTSQ